MPYKVRPNGRVWRSRRGRGVFSLQLEGFEFELPDLDFRLPNAQVDGGRPQEGYNCPNSGTKAPIVPLTLDPSKVST